MMPAESSGSTDPRYTLHYLPPNSELWGGLLPQFILRVAVVENVSWAGSLVPVLPVDVTRTE